MRAPHQAHVPHVAHPPHVESYFLKLNDPGGRRALWLKATILVRAGSVRSGRGARESSARASLGDAEDGTSEIAEAWAIAFDRERGHVAVKDTTSLEAARFSPRGLDIDVCKLHISPGRVAGSVGEGADAITFDLRFTMDAAALVPFPSERMYETALPSSKLVSPHPDSRFSGSYTVRGETVEARDWKGMQGHNWGTRHAELYAWCHVNAWTDEPDLVLEGLTARVKVGPLLAPPLTLVCVRHRGVRYDFNAPVTLARARGRIDEFRKWTFHAKNKLAEVSGEMFAETADMVGLAYENPDGAVTHCLNSKIARGRLRLSIAGRPDLDAVTRAAALEIGTKDPRHGVTMRA